MRVRWIESLPPFPGHDEWSSYAVEGEVIGTRAGFLGLGTVLIVKTKHGLQEVNMEQAREITDGVVKG
jgi:hypothetical protein